MNVVKCPNCNMILNKVNNVYKCENGHCFDIASKGYTNMLLANQHHSFNSGDSKEMILSRVRFLGLDYYHFLRQKILETIMKYNLDNDISFCDLACGEGYYTNYIHENLLSKYKVNTIGVDISKQAIIEACKKRNSHNLPNIDYFIGNLMNLPFIDNSFNVMLNCFAPMFENEFYRVLKNDGLYIRVLPDSDHLIGIKKVLYDKVILNVMKETNIKGFELIDTITISDNITLKNSQEIYDLFTMTPYYYKTSKEAINKLISLDSLDTKLSFVILVYRKKEKI